MAIRASYLVLAVMISSFQWADADGGGDQLWCVAKNNAEDAALQAAIDWACGPGGSDCRPIQQGGTCFQPDDIQSHASFAFNDYFIRHASDPSACDFSGTAALTSLNPSVDTCVYPSSIGQIMISRASNGSFSGSIGSELGPSGSNDSSGGYSLQLKTWLFSLTMAGAVVVLF